MQGTCNENLMGVNIRDYVLLKIERLRKCGNESVSRKINMCEKFHRAFAENEKFVLFVKIIV